MKNKVLIHCDSLDKSSIEELNASSSTCEYSLTKQKGISIPPEVLIIIFELVKNLSYSATYDLLKLSCMAILNKLKALGKKHNKVVIICDDKKSVMEFPFDLNESQKEKIVDAAIEKLLK